jgi:hypothetical protein
LTTIVPPIVTTGTSIIATATSTSSCDTLTRQYGTSQTPNSSGGMTRGSWTPIKPRETPSERKIRCTNSYLADLKRPALTLIRP